MPRKPEPLFIDGRYRYTLSSYEPAEVTVTIPYVSDDDVSLGVAGVLRECGWQGAGEPDDAWVGANVQGASSPDDLRATVRAELARMNESYAEASKASECAGELAGRLEQSVPAAVVARLRESILQGLEAQTQQAGLSLSDALAGMGVEAGSLDAMLDEQARDEAEREAALDAYAQHKGLAVDETELPSLLGLSPKDARALIADARAHGQLDDVLAHALRVKASGMVVAECRCTYAHETPEHAAARADEIRARRAAWTMPDGSRPHDEPPAGEAPHLKLV